MYEYKFVELKVSWRGVLVADYHEVIRQHAAEGWRLIQILGPMLVRKKRTPAAEAIFERPAEPPYASPSKATPPA